MEVLVVLITLAVITVVGILIFLGVRAIFEFIVDHACLKYIVIGIFALALADMLGPEILLIVGVILFFKLVINGIGYISYKLFPSKPTTYIPGINEKATVHEEEDEFIDIATYEQNDEIIDSDIYEDRYGNKYKYDRRRGELIDIDRNYNRIKVSQNGIYDSELEDSKGYSYDSIN